MARKSMKMNPFQSRMDGNGPGDGVKKKTPVTPENTAKFTDWEKKDKAIHGIGAKAAPKGTEIGDAQRAAFKPRVEGYKESYGHYPTKSGYAQDHNVYHDTKGGVSTKKRSWRDAYKK